MREHILLRLCHQLSELRGALGQTIGDDAPLVTGRRLTRLRKGHAHLGGNDASLTDQGIDELFSHEMHAEWQIIGT